MFVIFRHLPLILVISHYSHASSWPKPTYLIFHPVIRSASLHLPQSVPSGYSQAHPIQFNIFQYQIVVGSALGLTIFPRKMLLQTPTNPSIQPSISVSVLPSLTIILLSLPSIFSPTSKPLWLEPEALKAKTRRSFHLTFQQPCRTLTRTGALRDDEHTGNALVKRFQNSH